MALRVLLTRWLFFSHSRSPSMANLCTFKCMYICNSEITGEEEGEKRDSCPKARCVLWCKSPLFSLSSIIEIKEDIVIDSLEDRF